jgi:hypothetical protein
MPIAERVKGCAEDGEQMLGADRQVIDSDLLVDLFYPRAELSFYAAGH